ncbi:hypothetical protein TRIUR3_14470 [Triticum urartu]|uniref:Uncharacterized protein n=1 Tax=Triticum urartu TaxID=4572 RepID=M7ZY22_TRIUA|nr:hypothetical protein TRIUR3_14470 [Triticum urartu]
MEQRGRAAISAGGKQEPRPASRRCCDSSPWFLQLRLMRVTELGGHDGRDAEPGWRAAAEWRRRRSRATAGCPGHRRRGGKIG